MIAYRYADTDQLRPRHRVTVDYQLTPNFQPGIEYNFAVKELGLRATWVLQTENETRPMIHVNTSSDRIGTPEGYQQASMTFGRSIHGTKLAPYASITYSGFEKKFVFPFGASCQLAPNWSVLGMNDGRKSHLLLNYMKESYYVQLGWIWFERPAVTIGWGF